MGASCGEKERGFYGSRPRLSTAAVKPSLIKLQSPDQRLCPKSGAIMTWNPQTYLAFADQRTRPAADLLARIPAERPTRVIDLGCGPGNSTALLAARWPQAE